jgi:hypothetical protein
MIMPPIFGNAPITMSQFAGNSEKGPSSITSGL